MVSISLYLPRVLVIDSRHSVREGTTLHDGGLKTNKRYIGVHRDLETFRTLSDTYFGDHTQ